MNRPELIKKKTKLYKEIEELNVLRWKEDRNHKISKELENKKKEYKFYNNLIKEMKK